MAIIASSLVFDGVHAAAAKPSAYDLVGNWTGIMEFGKFKFRMIIKIAKSPDGKIKLVMDAPEQGMRGMPVTALLYNHPEVRIEIDQFRTAFNGVLNSALDQIDGSFEEGPGGRPFQVVFKRSREAEKPEPPKSYTFAPGETPDLRGYWKTVIEPMPEFSVRIGLKIGRTAGGKFSVMMDVLDQGAADIPASSVAFNKPDATIEWQFMQTTFAAKLSNDGKKLAGNWKQMGRSQEVTFERVSKPASALPDNLSFAPAKDSHRDVRGFWKGTLEAPAGMKLRLAFKIGQTPDGIYGGTLTSIDQGNREIPMTSVGYTNPIVRLEIKGIRGTYTGTLNQEGSVLDGKWEQMGLPIPLKLERGNSTDANANP